MAKQQKAAKNIPATATTPIGIQRDGPKNFAAGGAALAAVVLTVSVTLAVVTALLNVSDETEEPFCANEHDAPDGRPEHARLSTVPVKPFIAVNVRPVVPVCPGLGTVTVVGEAAIDK